MIVLFISVMCTGQASSASVCTKWAVSEEGFMSTSYINVHCSYSCSYNKMYFSLLKSFALMLAS